MNDIEDLTWLERLFLTPRTALGWGSIAAIAFGLCLGLLPFGTRQAGTGGAAGFWGNLPGALMLVGTAIFGIASGVLSFLAIWRRDERFMRRDS